MSNTIQELRKSASATVAKAVIKMHILPPQCTHPLLPSPVEIDKPARETSPSSWRLLSAVLSRDFRSSDVGQWFSHGFSACIAYWPDGDDDNNGREWSMDDKTVVHLRIWLRSECTSASCCTYSNCIGAGTRAGDFIICVYAHAFRFECAFYAICSRKCNPGECGD